MGRSASPRVYLESNLAMRLNTLPMGHKEKKMIDCMAQALKENMFAGECIRKKLMPRHYIEKFGVNNLYRYQHPGGYRSCYTLINEPGIGICPHILDLMTHPQYDERFGYNTT